MKKTVLISLAVLLVLAVFAGCMPKANGTAANDTGADEAADMGYSFEFTDVNGKVHRLSDYKGKPVYLEIWGSWCSICMAGLEDMNDFAGEDHDFIVLSVIFPNHAGEKSKDDFIAWYKELGYDNLIVMIDEDLQIIKDFGINGFPSNIFFDADSNFYGGQIGPMTTDEITSTMNALVQP